MLLLAWLPVLACSNGGVASGVRTVAVDSSAAAGAGPTGEPGQELIPAEWTVFEDTSEIGEVITASLQLPAAKDIEGLLRDEAPRLLLRCVDGKVEASIDPRSGDPVESGPDSFGMDSGTVTIELDSAPACE
jgi:hypothetical protein